MAAVTRDLKDERIIRVREVQQRTGLCRSSIYNLIRDGQFPRQIHLSVRIVGWLESDIEYWLQQRILNSKQKDGA